MQGYLSTRLVCLGDRRETRDDNARKRTLQGTLIEWKAQYDLPPACFVKKSKKCV